MADTLTKTRDSVDDLVSEPGRYKVVFYNDDATPVDFVVSVLMQIFKHSEETALDLTLKVHNEGSAVAGVFTYEIAEQKSMETTNAARNLGYPLVVKVESE